jgi:hypothetical protein
MDAGRFSLRAIAVEPRADARRGSGATPPRWASALQVIEGAAPAAAESARPEAIFISGGAAIRRDRGGHAGAAAGGRLVINAVTLATQQLMVERHDGKRRRARISPLRAPARSAARAPPAAAAGDLGVGEAVIVAGVGCRRCWRARNRNGDRTARPQRPRRARSRDCNIGIERR